jgi:hypothetical protein
MKQLASSLPVTWPLHCLPCLFTDLPLHSLAFSLTCLCTPLPLHFLASSLPCLFTVFTPVPLRCLASALFADLAALPPDLGYVGGGMPTTEDEAKEFAANVADPLRHLRKAGA